jgi:uncharacterized membrane protein YoaK (UPF0700 family)
MTEMTNKKLLALRERLGDPMLTVLALMLAILMFVVGPLQAAGIVAAHHFGLAFGLVLMAAVFIVLALFCFVGLLVPNAFVGLGPLQDNLAVAGNLIYFSFVTLTSVGYGDIVPLHPFARGLSNVEAIIGQLYPATLLARLVTLEIESRRRP